MGYDMTGDDYEDFSSRMNKEIATQKKEGTENTYIYVLVNIGTNEPNVDEGMVKFEVSCFKPEEGWEWRKFKIEPMTDA